MHLSQNHYLLLPQKITLLSFNANFLLILKLHETMPPKELIGSHLKLTLKNLIIIFMY